MASSFARLGASDFGFVAAETDAALLSPLDDEATISNTSDSGGMIGWREAVEVGREFMAAGLEGEMAAGAQAMALERAKARMRPSLELRARVHRAAACLPVVVELERAHERHHHSHVAVIGHFTAPPDSRCRADPPLLATKLHETQCIVKGNEMGTSSHVDWDVRVTATPRRRVVLQR